MASVCALAVPNEISSSRAMAFRESPLQAGATLLSERYRQRMHRQGLDTARVGKPFRHDDDANDIQMIFFIFRLSLRRDIKNRVEIKSYKK
jgi:hypothetical protein